MGVVDGDTIDVQLEDGNIYRLRYIGMDTPESGDYCRSEATNLNRAMVEGKPVLLANDVSEFDRFGRLLRYVFVDNIFINYELVIQGYAHQVSYPPDVAYVDVFREAQRIARDNGRGCWAATPIFTAVPTQPPPPPTEKTPENCHPSYPDVCIPPPPPDLDCGDIPNMRFKVVGSDPHRFDGDHDGIGYER